MPLAHFAGQATGERGYLDLPPRATYDIPLGMGYGVGSARIWCSQPSSVVVATLNAATSAYAYEGIPDSPSPSTRVGTATTVYVPCYRNQLWGWSSGLDVQNITGSSAAVTAYFLNDNGTVATTVSTALGAYAKTTLTLVWELDGRER